MISVPTTIEVPLRTDQDGVIRVGHSRVTLTTIIHRYWAGDTPEEIHDGFPTVSLAEVFAVIAYYLAHPEEGDEYVKRVEDSAERWQRDYLAANPQAAESNAKMQALLAEKRGNDEVFASIDQNMIILPPGVKSSLELLREDREH